MESADFPCAFVRRADRPHLSLSTAAGRLLLLFSQFPSNPFTTKHVHTYSITSLYTSVSGKCFRLGTLAMPVEHRFICFDLLIYLLIHVDLL